MMHEAIAPSAAVRCTGLDDPPTVARIAHWLADRPDASAFHRPEWVTGAARGTRQEAMALIAEDARGALCGYLPLNLIHSPLFGRALVSSGFAVGGGILAESEAIAAKLGNAAIDLAARHACDTVELRGGMAPGAGWTVRTDSHVNFARPLAACDDDELRAIPRRHRAEIRKGLERDVTVTVGSDETFRAAHYALFQRSVHNLGTPVFPRALFDAVMDAFGDNADIMLVSENGRPLSSVLSLYHRGACMPYWQGADREARAARANEVLYFRLMGHARERGCTMFDFGRSKCGSGPAAYKKNWGFTPEPLTYFIWAAPGHETRDINPTSPHYRAKIDLWKRLPPVVVDRLGPWIARGLG